MIDYPFHLLARSVKSSFSLDLEQTVEHFPFIWETASFLFTIAHSPFIENANYLLKIVRIGWGAYLMVNSYLMVSLSYDQSAFGLFISHGQERCLSPPETAIFPIIFSYPIMARADLMHHRTRVLSPPDGNKWDNFRFLLTADWRIFTDSQFYSRLIVSVGN